MSLACAVLSIALLLIFFCVFLVLVAPFGLRVDAGSGAVRGAIKHPLMTITWSAEPTRLSVEGTVLELPIARSILTRSLLRRTTRIPLTPSRGERSPTLNESIARMNMLRHAAGDAVRDFAVVLRPGISNPFLTGLLCGFFYATD